MVWCPHGNLLDTMTHLLFQFVRFGACAFGCPGPRRSWQLSWWMGYPNRALSKGRRQFRDQAWFGPLPYPPLPWSKPNRYPNPRPNPEEERYVAHNRARSPFSNIDWAMWMLDAEGTFWLRLWTTCALYGFLACSNFELVPNSVKDQALIPTAVPVSQTADEIYFRARQKPCPIVRG